VKSLYQVVRRHSDQGVGIGTYANQMLHGLAFPKVGGEQGVIAFLGLVADDDQSWEDAVQMADDLVLQRGAHFDFAEAHPTQVLELQIDTGRWIEGGPLSSLQQVTNGCRVNVVILLVLHHVLVPVLLDGEAIDQRHRLGSFVQMTSQVLKVVTAGLHPSQDHPSSCPNDGLVDSTTQLLKPAPEDVDLKRGRHDLSQGVVDDDHVEVLMDVQGDAQDLIQRNTTNLVSKRLSSLTPQVSMPFPAHNWYLLNMDVPVGESGTGQKPCASPISVNGLRPLHTIGRRHFTCIDGGVNHPQNL